MLAPRVRWVGTVAVVLVAGCGSTHAQNSTSGATRPASVTAVTMPIGTSRTPRFGRLLGQRALDILPSAGSTGSPLPFVEGGLFRERTGGRAFAVDVYGDGGVCRQGPVAALSPNRQYLLYDTDDASGRPVLMSLDTRTDQRRVFRRDACSPVWSSTNEIAYVTVSHVDVSEDYEGVLSVRHGIHGTDVKWGSGRDDAPLAWTAGKLLVLHNGDALQSFTAARGVITRRDLYSNSTAGPAYDTPNVSLVAVSPNSRYALLNLLEPGRAADVVVLVGTDTGHVLSRFLMPNTQEAVGLDGDWSGDRIITTNATYPGEGTYSPALITFVLHGTHITDAVEREIYDDHQYLDGSDSSFADQPRYLDAHQGKVGLWFSAYFGEIQYVRCNTNTARCAADRGTRGGTTPNGLFVTTTRSGGARRVAHADLGLPLSRIEPG